MERRLAAIMVADIVGYSSLMEDAEEHTAKRVERCQDLIRETASSLGGRVLRGLVGTKLRSFREVVLGTRVHVFGNVAVAVASCEITENDDTVNRGVEMLLLIRDDGFGGSCLKHGIWRRRRTRSWQNFCGGRLLPSLEGAQELVKRPPLPDRFRRVAPTYIPEALSSSRA